MATTRGLDPTAKALIVEPIAPIRQHRCQQDFMAHTLVVASSEGCWFNPGEAGYQTEAPILDDGLQREHVFVWQCPHMEMAAIGRCEIADRQLLQLVQRHRHIRECPSLVGGQGRIDHDAAHFVVQGKGREIVDSTPDDALSVSGGCLPLFANREQEARRNFKFVMVCPPQPGIEISLGDRR